MDTESRLAASTAPSTARRDRRDRWNDEGERVDARRLPPRRAMAACFATYFPSERGSGLVARPWELAVGRHGSQSDETEQANHGCRQMLLVHRTILFLNFCLGLEGQAVYRFWAGVSSPRLFFGDLRAIALTA